MFRFWAGCCSSQNPLKSYCQTFDFTSFAKGFLMDIVQLGKVEPFITKDGSEIRELLSHRNSSIRLQSLAEARVPSGTTTQLHFHVRTEEIYYITHGQGKVRLEDQWCEVKPGDAIAIPPGTRHQITADTACDLCFLCCCSPAYEHEDTVLL